MSILPSKDQKQPFADVLQNNCSEKFRNIQRKTPAMESRCSVGVFNKYRYVCVCRITPLRQDLLQIVMKIESSISTLKSLSAFG